jgi:hypothetical protein
MTSSKIDVWGPQGQAPDSGLGDSVRETGCHYEGMPSRGQTLREGKPGSPLPRRAENVDGGLLSDDVTGSICMMYVFGCCAETKHSIVVKLGTLTKSTMRYLTMSSPSQSAHAQCILYVFGCCAEMSDSIVMKLGMPTKSTMRYSAMTSLSQFAHAQYTLNVFGCLCRTLQRHRVETLNTNQVNDVLSHDDVIKPQISSRDPNTFVPLMP